GHNFGAPHDNQGGAACVTTPGTFLMNPFTNGSQQFSQCNLDQIASVINARNCRSPIDDGGDGGDGGGDGDGDDLDCNFSIDFSNGAQGFTFVPDGQTPQFTTGRVANGALTIDVGGVNNDDVTNMIG